LGLMKTPLGNNSEKENRDRMGVGDAKKSVTGKKKKGCLLGVRKEKFCYILGIQKRDVDKNKGWKKKKRRTRGKDLKRNTVKRARVGSRKETVGLGVREPSREKKGAGAASKAGRAKRCFKKKVKKNQRKKKQ